MCNRFARIKSNIFNFYARKILKLKIIVKSIHSSLYSKLKILKYKINIPIQLYNIYIKSLTMKV